MHLGANVPYADLRRAQREVGASVVVLSVTRDLTADEAAAARTELASLAKEVEVWVGAPPGNAMALMPGVRAFDSFESFDTAVLHRFPGG